MGTEVCWLSVHSSDFADFEEVVLFRQLKTGINQAS